MRIVKPSAMFINPDPFDREASLSILKKIELAGRVCYKSEDKITSESVKKFIKNVTARGHLSVIEHGNLTARVICDRGVTHELVRHRLCSYSQESTRYCNYAKENFGNEITVIEPSGLDDTQREHWIHAVSVAESEYLNMTKGGCSPQIARSVLPNCLKTEIVITANLREWRHILNLRVSNPAAHPQIRQALNPLLIKLHEVMPEVYSDITAILQK